MFLGLTWLGWAILIAAYVPVALLLGWLAHRFSWRSTAFGATAIVTAIPFGAAIAEAIYVEYNWRALCATAKTEIKRKVVVEGFYDAAVSGGYAHFKQDPKADFKHGFRFVEWKDNEGGIWRTEGFTNSELRTVRIDKPTARYHWHMDRFGTPAGHLLKRSEDTIVDVQTGEVIARHITGARYPAFADRLWRQWFDNVPTECGTKRAIRSETLIGIDRKEELK